MSDKLKPCPFCGGKAKVWKSGSYGVVCNTCDANTGFIYPNEQEPVEAWNKRNNTEVIGKIRDWARNEPIGYGQYSTIDLLDFLKLIEEEGL